ncbi:MAG TPA: hypothetical protein VJM49_02125, partial [Acidimicrobiales bacterium]|nr:hypothetical protein [Acidimicrobiales bacterium]
MALVASSLGAWATPSAPAGDSGSATVDRTAQPAGSSEYVISYQGEASAAADAVAGAGGQVIDVNEDIGIALVTSADAGFLGAVQATDAVTGAARNHAVGTSRLGQPHRFAEERPSAADRAAHAGA